MWCSGKQGAWVRAEPGCSPDDLDLRIVLPSQVFGGAERTVLNLLEGMARLPTQPRVTLYGHAGMLRPHLAGREGVAVVDVSDWGLGTALRGLRSTRRDARVLADHVAKHRDRDAKTVVLGFLHYGAAMAVWMRRFLAGQPRLSVIASPRGPSCAGIPMISANRYIRFLLHTHVALAGRWCDAVVVPSQGMREELVARYHAQPKRVMAIANSYPTVADGIWQSQAARMLRGKTAGFRFVMATRLSAEKNILLALDAFARHAPSHPNDSFTIVGDGPARTEVEAKIAAHGLAQRVRLQPFEREPFELIAQHDVYLHTCLIEGFGNSMIEALAVGVPVIATDCDFGPREIVIQGINGLLVPKHDVGAFAQAMADIQKLPPERLRAAARDSAQIYSNFAMAARYVDVFCRA